MFFGIATSADVERGFSRNSLMVPKQRHSLSDESTRDSVALDWWGRVPGMLPEEEMMKVFRDKAKRSAGRATAAKVIHKAKGVVINTRSDSDSSDSEVDDE
jgi:hypothetical protein